MSATISVGDRLIGEGQPCYIIAEMSANHGQSLDHALKILHAARDAGADAVKLQTYTPDTLTISSDRPEFRVGEGTLWAGKNLYELYAEAATPWEWHRDLQRAAKDLGLDFFSTPFDRTAIDFLEGLGVPVYKVASFELVDHGLIALVAKTGRPMILSTGMATLEEIDEAVQAFRAAGGTQCALLKCNSAYPARPEEMNLRTIPDMSARFGVPVGLSDHTLGLTAATTAVALGACILEKHLTLARADGGPDGAFSLEPEEFREMVSSVRDVERTLGRVSYEVSAKENASRAFRRSLFVVADVATGETLTEQNVRSIRPAGGLAPKHASEVYGRVAAKDLQRGSPLRWEDVAEHASSNFHE